MDHIEVKRLSKQSLAKIRKGKMVTIHPIEEGKGMLLAAHPDIISKIRKSFMKGRGCRHKIEDHEMEDNHELGGRGIGGAWLDKQLNKMGMREAAYKIGDQIKNPVKAGLATAIVSGGTALMAAQPWTTPFLLAGIPAAVTVMNGFLDKPSDYGMGRDYGTRKGQSTDSKKYSNQDMYGQGNAHLLNQINQHTGQNLGSLDQAAMGSAASNYMSGQIANKQAAALQTMTPYSSSIIDPYTKASKIVQDLSNPFDEYGSNAQGYSGVAGMGLSKGMAKEKISGMGLYASGGGLLHNPSKIGSRHYRHRMERGSVSIGGNLLSSGSHIHPAMVSQPFGSNYCWGSTLPPNVQIYSKSAGVHL